MQRARNRGLIFDSKCSAGVSAQRNPSGIIANRIANRHEVMSLFRVGVIDNTAHTIFRVTIGRVGYLLIGIPQ